MYNKVIGFFVSRWRRSVPLRQLLLRDMLLHGSLINLATGFAGLWLLASEGPPAIGFGLYFGAVPYNLFLCWALWRTAETAPPPHAAGARLFGVVWLLAMLIV